MSNCRPMVILSNLCKLFEIILYGIIYIVVKNRISKHYHGLHEKKCTNSACFTVEVGQVDVIYIDFRKAFEQTNYILLTKKLAPLGLSPALLYLLQNYLFGQA